ncbi:MAG: Do family serine endopeptidase [Clostridium sp.]|nr:Do family serine endopeptidase [Prevotella sp.]MCM1428758.1 Do family serine endopeptidase [Clostridium sp.]MCM1475133.1 Do family serine endopeptidase [Muribaculaceae bacterium]
MIKKLIATSLFAGMIFSVSASEHQGVGFVRTAATPTFETDFTVAAEKTVNEVVCIKSFASSRSPRRGQQQMQDPFDFFDFFFNDRGNQQRQQGQRRGERQQQPSEQNKMQQLGLGSGVIISSDGYIVTNNHVIDGADRLDVLLNDNKTYVARVIGTDEATDLALIKIDATGLPFITFGDSDRLKVGEWVLAVGNPFGFNSTVTAGIVSAKARAIGQGNRGGNMTIESYIQTDAALNPGNSGGALVNLKGELVGINSAIYSNTGSYTGYSFAIPSTIVQKIVEDLREYKSVQRAVLGCSVVELTSELAEEKGITATSTGVVVVSVNDKSTAKEMGLQEDDVIIAINGVHIGKFSELQGEMSKFRPGDQITLTYYRKNKKYEKSATLRNSQGETVIVAPVDFSTLGAVFAKISEEKKEELDINNGVEIKELKDGPFKDAGLKVGYVITEVDGTPVSSPDDIEEIFNALQREGNAQYFFVTAYDNKGKKLGFAVNL